MLIESLESRRLLSTFAGVGHFESTESGTTVSGSYTTTLTNLSSVAEDFQVNRTIQFVKGTSQVYLLTSKFPVHLEAGQTFNTTTPIQSATTDPGTKVIVDVEAYELQDRPSTIDLSTTLNVTGGTLAPVPAPLTTRLDITAIASPTLWFTFANGSNGDIYDMTPHRVGTSDVYLYDNGMSGFARRTCTLTDNGPSLAELQIQVGNTATLVCSLNSDYTSNDNSSNLINLWGAIVDGNSVDDKYPDLSTRQVILHNTSSAFVKAAVIAGRNGGTYDGNGIRSSAAQSFNWNTGNEDYVVGWGILVGGDVVVKFTGNGDANLDGVCDDQDVTIVGGYYDNGATTTYNWVNGDFNYDGKVDDNDVTILGAYYTN